MAFLKIDLKRLDSGKQSETISEACFFIKFYLSLRCSCTGKMIAWDFAWKRQTDWKDVHKTTLIGWLPISLTMCHLALAEWRQQKCWEPATSQKGYSEVNALHVRILSRDEELCRNCWTEIDPLAAWRYLYNVGTDVALEPQISRLFAYASHLLRFHRRRDVPPTAHHRYFLSMSPLTRDMPNMLFIFSKSFMWLNCCTPG